MTGMKTIEAALFCAGAVLLSVSLVSSLWPAVRRRVGDSAERHTRDLRQEFLDFTPQRLILVFSAAAGLVSAVTMVATRNPFAAAAMGALLPFGAGIAVRLVRKRRRDAIVAQIPSFLDMLEGYVKAGHSLPEAFADASSLLPRGIREEIAWIAHMNRIGTPFGEALRLWDERMSCEDVSLFVRPLRVILPSGGNVANLLARSRDVLRASAAQKDKMRSLTAQGRFQAVVLTLLTPAFAVALSVVDPEFLPRLTGTSLGKALLAAAAFLQVTGWIVIRRILSVRP